MSRNDTVFSLVAETSITGAGMLLGLPTYDACCIPAYLHTTVEDLVGKTVERRGRGLSEAPAIMRDYMVVRWELSPDEAPPHPAGAYLTRLTNPTIVMRSPELARFAGRLAGGAA